MKRIESLDSLRGIAAAIVVFHHYALIFSSDAAPTLPPWSGGSWSDPWSWIKFSPLKLLFCGEQAVLVFFTLSGFVLALAFKTTRVWDYRGYLVKRVCRIYIPFAAAIAFSALLFELAHPEPVPGLSSWFNHASWNKPLTTGILLGHFAMLEGSGFGELDNVMWSLIHEMRISIIFPLLALCVRRRWFETLCLSILISIAAHVIDHYLRAQLSFNIFKTLAYLYLFAAGAAMAFNTERITSYIQNLRPLTRGLIWLSALYCITLQPYHTDLFICGAASILLVALCFADRRVDNWLSSPIPVWLGRVSYSLYLLHLPILLFILHSFFGRAPLFLLLTVSTVLSLFASELAYRFVEVPAIRIGRKFSMRERPSGAETV